MNTSDVQRQLQKLGFRPQQAAGQNFLTDQKVVDGIIDVANIGEDDTILEIGPGLGILTESLLATGAKVVAVELDKRLSSYLAKRFEGVKNLQLITDDIFKVNLPAILQDGQYKLVANLPYSGTALVFRNFLTLKPRPSDMTLMVQREVGQRMTAPAGQLSVLAVMVQYYSQIEAVFDVPPEKFYPIPKVWSSVVHLHDLRPLDPEGDKHLFRVIKAGFSARRKQLRNTLSAGLHIPIDEVVKIMESAGLKPTARAQEIPVATWLKIAPKLR